MTDTPEPRPQMSLMTLLAVFLRIGLTSFGGSTSAWMHREIVERRRLLDDQQFMTGLTFAQVLPGANPVNLALYIGLQVRGGLGGAVAVFGMVIPAFCVILILGLLYRNLSQFQTTHVILGGIAAAGVGSTIAMGMKLGRRVLREVAPAAIAFATFAAVGLLHWPMVPVVLTMVPFSVAVALIMQRRRADVR